MAGTDRPHRRMVAGDGRGGGEGLIHSSDGAGADVHETEAARSARDSAQSPLSACLNRSYRAALMRADRLIASRYTLLLVAVLIVAIYSWQPGLSSDSIHYFDIGKTIATEGQVATYHLQVTSERIPETNLWWPPAYPYLLSVFMRLGLGNETAAFMVSTISHSAVVVLLLLMVRRPEWCLLGIIVWLQLIRSSGVVQMAWSEGPFVACLAGAMVSWGFALGGGWGRLLGLSALAGVLGGCALLTRYAGVSVIPAFLLSGFILGAIYRQDRVMTRKAIVAGAGASLISLAFLLLWMWRNYTLNGSLMGPERHPSVVSHVEALGMLAATVGGVGLATALPVLICLAVAGSRDGSAPPEAEHAVAPVRLWASIMVVGVWCAIYVLLLLWQEVTIKIDRVNARLMFPAYAGGLLIGLLLLEATCRLLPEQLRRLRLLTCVVILPLLLLPGARVFKQQHAQPTPLEDWVRRNTAEDALLVGRNIWGIRYATGRTVLTSQYGRDKSAALDGAALSVFLDRHGDRFDGVYLIVSAGEYAAAKESLRAAGMDADTVYRADVLGGSAVRVLQIAARGSP